MEFNLILQRTYDNGKTTQGTMVEYLPATKKFIFEGFTIEDEYRAVKLKGETRIWAKRYKLAIREELTELTKKYLADTRLPFFERHIEIIGVSDFVGTYIHLGNHEGHTDGCVLIGDTIHNIDRYLKPLEESVIAYERFYKKWYPRIKDKNNTVWIDVFDEVKLLA